MPLPWPSEHALTARLPRFPAALSALGPRLRAVLPALGPHVLHVPPRPAATPAPSPPATPDRLSPCGRTSRRMPGGMMVCRLPGLCCPTIGCPSSLISVPWLSCGPSFMLPPLPSCCSPPNTYMDSSGGTQCVPCPAGTTAAVEGSASCYPCPEGTYAPTSTAGCLPAPAGTFVAAVGATAYTYCPPGTSSSYEGNVLCPPCPGGALVGLLRRLPPLPAPQALRLLLLLPPSVGCRGAAGGVEATVPRTRAPATQVAHSLSHHFPCAFLLLSHAQGPTQASRGPRDAPSALLARTPTPTQRTALPGERALACTTLSCRYLLSVRHPCPAGCSQGGNQPRPALSPGPTTTAAKPNQPRPACRPPARLCLARPQPSGDILPRRRLPLSSLPLRVLHP